MAPRRFGIEFEACVTVEPFGEANNRSWNEKIRSYLHFLHRRYAGLPATVKTWCESFENTVFIYTFPKRELYNFATDTITPLKSDEIYSYDKPILMPDATVLCHGNFEKNRFEAQTRENFGLTDTTNFTLNIEFTTQILKSFEEWEYFRQAILPEEDMILRNVSQGIHLNIGVGDLTVEQIKRILVEKYAPWEREHAREIRPFPSDWARELDESNLTSLATLVKEREWRPSNNVREALNTVLTKYKSVHFKRFSDGILEFRLFSTIGANIEERMREIYVMFPPVVDSGGRRKQARTKKLKSRRCGRKSTKNQR